MPNFTVDQTQYTSIIEAIEQLATTQSGLTFNGSKVYEMPTPEDLQSAGYPYFVVRRGKIKAFATGLSLNAGEDDGERGLQQVEPVWDFDCYVLYPYQDAQTNDNLVAQAAVSMAGLFLNQYTLNGMVSSVTLVNPHSWSFPYVQIGDVSLNTAKFTLRVYEVLNSIYS